KLGGADLREAKLGGADLREANVRTIVYSAVGTNDGGTAEFTNLSTVRNLTQSQLETMDGDSGTILPDHLTRPAHWPDWRDHIDELSTPEADHDTVTELPRAEPSSTELVNNPPEQGVASGHMVTLVQRRTRSELRSALLRDYPSNRDLAQQTAEQVARELALHKQIPTPNSAEALSDHHARETFLQETLITLEALHAALPEEANPVLSDEKVDGLRTRLVALAQLCGTTVARLDANTGTAGNLWRVGVIAACTNVLAALIGTTATVALPVAAGIVGATTIRLYLKRED
ncbi:MAG: hypothetical protein AAFX00_12185, partial [Pseudomonadota bacterium]